ncbi:MAG: transcriptional regulator [Saprospiraceae bacterium]|nr:transcriptional regulator [Saprospiraceae bacterium]
MKNLITGLNKHFDHRVRLGIMSILMVSDWVDFTTLKTTLDVTDGRLASHIKALEKEQYLKIRKTVIGKKPNTAYCTTERGKKAFRAHLEALEKLIKLT